MELTCFGNRIILRESPAESKEVKKENSQLTQPAAERLRFMARFGIGVKQRREK